MKKAGRILVLLAGMGIVLRIALTAKADEAIGSCNTLQFQSIQGNMQIWAEDINLLQDKLSGIPQEAFRPDYYSGG